MKPQVAFFGNGQETIDSVYPLQAKEKLAQLADVFPETINKDNFEALVPKLQNVCAVFSTWGMPGLDDGQVKQLPNLKLLLYGAGSVKGFATPFLENGVRLVGAWQGNGESVAELTIGEILLSCKGYFRNCREFMESNHHNAYQVIGEGNFHTKVAILGAGAIGRRVIKILRESFHHEILLYDPYVDIDEARKLGCEKATLEECFEKALVVSNHMPALPETEKIIGKKHFSSMRDGASFINTGRASSVDQDAMIEVLNERADLSALLDVTSPEPLPKKHILFSMPNVRVSTHIAGALKNEQQRMGLFLVDTFEKWLKNDPISCEITLEMLKNMA